MEGCIYQLNLSDGGVPKTPVADARVTLTGLVGDRQRYTKIHGGPQRALCLYSLERIEALREEGHPIFPGSVGENVTVAGLDWNLVKPGVRLALGEEVLIEITSYVTPCKTIAASFAKRDWHRIRQEKHPGDARLYARVLHTGRLAVGQSVRLADTHEAA
ncbi:MAG TPA: MOSC domain-containing protein [Pyrinomonadaceae bacterium]|nr:MOSC domain-containing protein [Pyrinomonadaceae bacterium]